ncbi:hypothetical protein C5167_042977 [Papaver somniferum]|uniref:Senescence regulator S40 n=1 Tax=Papaver somniferum TaxID=3469 RepID=A0A4Y7L630_PAPSO|nr:uncharacterized protein LOC113318077 [Papaver somniferum]XP_026421988.1 uncharacterized protein LOC113318077 [Papaver somniferum]RZC80407.1 hypothetical protein C5167_042977 [Papaver somniferum]
MAGAYGYFSQGSKGESSREDKNDEDFDEEDIWNIGKERRETSPRKLKKSSSDISSFALRGVPTGARMIIPKRINNEAKVHQQSSAPVNVPDWSKIYMKNSKGNGFGTVENDEDDGVDANGVKVPPHEWIAKKLEKSQISSFSVCEGAGRTLKGRDMSKVRNAVLTRTGFLE